MSGQTKISIKILNLRFLITRSLQNPVIRRLSLRTKSKRKATVRHTKRKDKVIVDIQLVVNLMEREQKLVTRKEEVVIVVSEGSLLQCLGRGKLSKVV